MRHLAEYCKDRSRLSKEDFAAKHPQPLLLHRVMSAEEPVDVSFKTVAAPVSSINSSLSPWYRIDNIHFNEPLAALGLSKTVSGPVVAELLVFPIAKQPGAVFQDRVSVGRTKNTDICLPSSKISKLHAFFTVPRSGLAYSLTDAESTNGTFVNGIHLPAKQAVEVGDWSLILFSKYQFLFFTPSCLYSLLRGD